jgi:maltooligosyltrehalose trehalohydrolase
MDVANLTDIALEALDLGAELRGEKCAFKVWAPKAKEVVLRLNGQDHGMRRSGEGYFETEERAIAGDRYFYVVDDKKRVPDPVSRLLPEGVHGATEIVDPESFRWADQHWRGIRYTEAVFYELHIGTFTSEGTFDAAIAKLPYLKRLGVSMIEIMPVCAFPGTRNWGYDGVSPYSVQASYGGPEGLKKLVDAAHAIGLGVTLDVVYNHLGNEGNYLGMFGPYFTERYKTPWGSAVNFDGSDATEVRRYFIENALFWIREYHMDGLRLDAVHAIFDNSQPHILQEIASNVHALGKQLGREVCIIAESDQNDATLVRPQARGGFGYDGVWSDDFHHAVHAALTHERDGYYQDYGRTEQILKALNEGFIFQGEHFQYWHKPRGKQCGDIPRSAHVFCLQNHDQVGNRPRGDRLTALISRGAQKGAAALLLLAPETPLLFMGEEYGEKNPFQFFTDFGDPALQKAVVEGRRNEFKKFASWGEVPDPQDPQTFARSTLSWQLDQEMLEWYWKLLELRKKYVIGEERTCKAELRDGAIVMEIPRERPVLRVSVNFSGKVIADSAWKLELVSDQDGCMVVVETSMRTRPFHQQDSSSA